MDKVVSCAAAAIANSPDGASLAARGLGLCGIPSALIGALLASDPEATGTNGADARLGGAAHLSM